MKRIKGTSIRKRVGRGFLANKPSKVHCNGPSGSVRIAISADGGLKAGDLVYLERLGNGIILIIPERIWKENEEK